MYKALYKYLLLLLLLSQLVILLHLFVVLDDRRCNKVLPIATRTYQEGAPSHYTSTVHGSRVSILAYRIRALDTSSGVSDQQSVGSSPGRDSCVLKQDT